METPTMTTKLERAKEILTESAVPFIDLEEITDVLQYPIDAFKINEGEGWSTWMKDTTYYAEVLGSIYKVTL